MDRYKHLVVAAEPLDILIGRQRFLISTDINHRLGGILTLAFFLQSPIGQAHVFGGLDLTREKRLNKANINIIIDKEVN